MVVLRPTRKLTRLIPSSAEDPGPSDTALGIMVDFARCVPSYLEPGGWDETTLPFVEGHLAETPCHAGRKLQGVVFPEVAAPALLESKWRARYGRFIGWAAVSTMPPA